MLEKDDDNMKLDIGCLDQDFKKQGYIGIDDGSMDWDSTNPDVFAKAESLPFKDKTIDEVFSSSCVGMYTEDKALNEIARVLKDDGILELWFDKVDYDRVKTTIKRLGFNVVELDSEKYDKDYIWLRMKFRRQEYGAIEL